MLPSLRRGRQHPVPTKETEPSSPGLVLSLAASAHIITRLTALAPAVCRSRKAAPAALLHSAAEGQLPALVTAPPGTNTIRWSENASCCMASFSSQSNRTPPVACRRALNVDSLLKSLSGLNHDRHRERIENECARSQAGGGTSVRQRAERQRPAVAEPVVSLKAFQLWWKRNTSIESARLRSPVTGHERFFSVACHVGVDARFEVQD